MKEKNIINFYVLCNKLKQIIRTGWTCWNVKRERLESIAEHVYGTQMLALAIYNEYKYDIDIYKVMMMLAVHEIGETIIGDLTVFDITKEEKIKKEHEAVHNILKNMLDFDEIEELFLEFDEGKTKEANFAYQCDKLECDIQAKLYDEEGCVDLAIQKSNNALENERVQSLMHTGMSWGEMWITFDQEAIKYDENFYKITEYIKNNKISE